MVSLTNFKSVGEQTAQRVYPDDDALPGDKCRKMPKKYYLNQTPSLEPSTNIDKQRIRQQTTTNSLQKSNGGHFEIRWSNLGYQVEPKWYQRKFASFLSSSSSSNNSKNNQTVTIEEKSKTLSSSASSQTQDELKKTILENLNGQVKSGQVTAVLGPSGAGKTSLLGCLTGKNKTGVSGSVQVISSRQEPMSICTIPQKDFLLGQLTVRENLWFASRLKNPQEPFDHDSNISRVLDLLKLQSCIDTKISKISGGQHKRVSIAQELLSNPDILILDEPTSGLDSLTCYKTVMVLRDLAQLAPNPMAIIVTIHQPQREVFDLFHWVYILASGGRCIYEGQPSNSIKTINECSGGHLQFDERQYNPASFLVEIASCEFGTKPIEALVENQANEFKRRTSAQDYELQQLSNSGSTEAAGALQLATPTLKKRQSAMARFKSTLSNITRTSSGASQAQMLQQNQQQQHQNQPLRKNSNSLPGQMYAYTNKAFIETQNDTKNNHQDKQPTIVVTNNDQKPSQVQDINKSEQQQQQNKQIIDSDAQSLGTDCLTNQSISVELSTIGSNDFYLDDRLQTHKHNHEGHFYRHCSLLTKRSWLCLCKDPMLTTLRFSAHIIVPLLITVVYGSRVGKPNACPLYETELDLIDYAKRGTKRLLDLQDDLRSTFENVGLFFLSIYAFTFSTMCLTSLSFPLNMHVLLKEVRNGWYSIPTYFIGKSLADFPLEFILPTVTLIITYPLTGQPESEFQWRFFIATIVFVVTSLIAQTQGLIFGALFMNAMQAAVFIAPVSTTPLILLSGFLIRIKKMPIYLQHLSSLSYFRYAIESLTIIRYGFGQCPCDPSVVTGEPVKAFGVPEQLRTMTNYWLSTFNDNNNNNNNTDLLNDTLLAPTTTLEPGDGSDFFQDLTVLLARANSFGANITTCADLKPYPMLDFGLEDNQLYIWLFGLFTTLIGLKVVNYFVVKYSVKLRL